MLTVLTVVVNSLGRCLRYPNIPIRPIGHNPSVIHSSELSDMYVYTVCVDDQYLCMNTVMIRYTVLRSNTLCALDVETVLDTNTLEV